MPAANDAKTGMQQRIAYGSTAVAMLVLLFLLDIGIARQSQRWEGFLSDLLSRGSILPVAFLVIVLRGAFELNRLMRSSGARPHARFAYGMIALLMLTPWFSAAGWLGSDPTDVEGLYWQLVWMIVAVIGTGLLSVLRRDPAGTIRDAGATLLMVFHLGFLSSFAVQLRSGRDVPDQEGAWLLLIVVLTIKASDIGAYFTGRLMGRHKLIPSISPGKSVEGAIGGLIASAAIAMVIAQQQWISLLFGIVETPNGLSPLWRACIFGVLLSAAGQLGDLVESCFKRDAGSKDSGAVIPQFGGILDLIDSPLVAVPVGWFLLTKVWNVV